ncbi:MAG: SDR family NAD(P)-dependent oxidoreductase [Candidatus Lokiarchaeota archaeon]|nr:SDR family NAD(P)-dependent oxidoreductase [Candidatus Lokiarchaeota archaeon]
MKVERMSIKKNIVITGGSSGIGRAIALEMAKNGHAIYIVSRSENKLEKVAKEIESAGGVAYFGCGDVANPDVVDALYNDILEKMASVDVLVANAGVGYFGNLEDMEIWQFDEQMNTNVRGVFLWIRKVLPEMKQKNSGQIIVTSSNLGLKTSARTSIYSATKHAVQAMVWCLREELRETQVKAATINPGSVSTPWFDGKDVDRERMLSATDIAKAARLIIDQDKTSDIDHILLLPAKN